MTNRMTKILVFPLIGLICNCGEVQDSNEQDSQISRNDAIGNHLPDIRHNFNNQISGSGVVIENVGRAKYPGQIRYDLNLVIGRDEGSENYILFRPTHISTDAEDNIYVLDNMRMSILVYDFAGRYIRTLGRKGEGPGEFLDYSYMHIFKDGTVDLIATGSRWIRWSPNGRLVFDRRPRNLIGSLGIHRRPTRGGSISFAVKNPWYGTVRADTSTGWWIISQDDSMRTQETVAVFPLGNPTTAFGTFEGARVGSVLPYSLDLIIAQGAQGEFALSSGDSAKFTLFDTSFIKVCDVIWDINPSPLTMRDVDDAFRLRSMNNELEDDKRLRFARSLNWPDTKPVISNILLSQDGRIWVECWGQDPWIGHAGRRNAASEYRYWIFNPQGELEYESVFPFRIMAVSSNYIYELTINGDTAPQVRRYFWRPPQ